MAEYRVALRSLDTCPAFLSKKICFQMTLEEIREIASDGESELVEFKRSTSQRKPAAETVCAMLNGEGGYVFIGVRSDGSIIGQEVADKTLRDVVTELRKIEPQIVLQPDVIAVESERAVVAISVPGERSGPYTYDGRAFVRQGPTTIQMDQDEYHRRLMEQSDPAHRWEAKLAKGVEIDDLDLSEITRTIDEAVRRGRMDEPETRDPEELLLGLGLLEEGNLLNAAVVLFGNEETLMPSYPQCLLRMARFHGTTKTEFEDNRQVRANTFVLLKRAQQFLREHLPIASRVMPEAIEREDKPLYPMEALREALANAFCHRDYSVSGGSVGIAIYDDRLEITSTGTLPAGITIQDLIRPHASKPRNDLIADVFYRRGIIEQWGRGTLKMVELTEKAGLVPPEFEEQGGELVVRFRPIEYVAPSRVEHNLSDLQRELLQIIGSDGPLALSSILKRLRTDAAERTIQENLQTLRELELINLKGHGRGARWQLAN